jgi:hypothetical protein
VFLVGSVSGPSKNVGNERGTLVDPTHRYRKSLNRLLKVCYVSATSAVLIAFFSSFFAAAINSTNKANKAAGTCR